MNKELEELLSTSTDMLKNALTSAQTELPEVIQQFLQWQFWNCIFTIVCCIIVSIIIWLSHKAIRAKIRKEIKEDTYLCDETSTMVIVAYAIMVPVALIIIIAFMDSMRDIIQIHFAPKVYMIEAIKDFIS